MFTERAQDEEMMESWSARTVPTLRWQTSKT